MDKYDAELLQARQDIRATMDRLRATATDAGKQDLDRFGADLDQYIAVQDKVRDLARRDTQAKATELTQKDAQQRLDQVLSPLQALRDRVAASAGTPEQMRPVLAAVRLSDALRTIQRMEKDIVIANDDAAVQRYSEQLTAALEQLPQLRQELDNLAPAQERPAVRDIFSRIDQWTRVLAQAVAQGSENANRKAFALSAGQGRQLIDAAMAQLNPILERNTRMMADERVATGATYESGRATILGTLLCSLLIGAAAAAWLSVSVNRSVRAHPCWPRRSPAAILRRP